jgi:hypothetical protein
VESLPIEAATEDDATEGLVGLQLREGHNQVARSRSGLELMVRAVPGKPLEYLIVDSQGKPVEEITEVKTTNTASGKTTCWECGVDAAGNRHCWKIPCPVITGPWEPGKVMVLDYVLA